MQRTSKNGRGMVVERKRTQRRFWTTSDAPLASTKTIAVQKTRPRRERETER